MTHLSSRSLSIIVTVGVLFWTWDKGNRINVHTPPVMIAMFGWVILLLEAPIIFDPSWVTHFLYGN